MSGSEKRLIRSKSGLRIIHVKDGERSPFELSEPEWIKDNLSCACSACETNFDFVRRKHHCRRCGKIYCNTCTKTRLALPRMCFLDPVRLCSECAKKTVEENSFYENDLKILLTGVILLVNDYPSSSELVHCCLSNNHRYLMLSGSFSKSIPLANISTISGQQNDGNRNTDEISISFIVRNESTTTELKAPMDAPPLTKNFLESLQKALLMANESKAVIGTGN